MAARLRADGVPGPARTLFDAYLAQAARTVTAYRTEIRIGEDPKDTGPGRLWGESAYLGRFTYRPVTYAELSRAERARLVHDPQFRAFLERQGRPAAPSSAPADFQVSLSPEEMLRSAPFVVVLRK
jgi:hypothetical protein